MRALPLLERKGRLERLLRDAGPALHYVRYIRGHAADVFEAACRMDLEGIVCRPADATYVYQPASWRKVMNATYGQKTDRRAGLFDRRR